MPLERNSTLLHYRLVEQIGEGGMGVVWKAVDTTLHRDVAIKVLPDLFASDHERLARFEREAKLLASLNHPNIASIYGLHKHEGTPFLAMEMVDGDDLAKRLSRGTLSRQETFHVALQIAQAFEAAHESGVIHRDLKPANVKLTPGGQVKVLDFGLAKAFLTETSGPGANPAMSPTLTSAGSIAGVVIGTASYMSPEQAKATEVDRRADIWSFGVVLFEMLTGRRLFEGETVSETLAAVIMKDIDWGALPADTPRPIRKLLERCLQRDPRSRLRDIGEARIAIEEALRAPEKKEADAVEVSTAPRPARPSLLPWGIAAAAAILAGWAWFSGSTETAPSPVMRFTMATAEDQPVDSTPIPALAISPDGTRIAYVGTVDGKDMLFLRHTHQQEAAPLKGTDEADNPFFSPDGEWIGFEAGSKLKKVSVLGGPPATLCDARRLRGATWGTDGTIIFTPNRAGGMMRVSEAGGEPEWLTLPDVEDNIGSPSHRWPDLLPDDRVVIFTATENNSDYSDAEIVALNLADKSEKTLIKGGTFGRFVPPGFLVYARENTLFAVRFDPERLEVTGSPVPVLEGVSGAANYGSKQLDFSDNGTLLYLAGEGEFAMETLTWIDRDGSETPATTHQRDYGFARISPDGKHVALEIIASSEDQGDIWILELERDTLTRLTYHDAWDVDPIWSPDGEWIVFASMRDGEAFNLYRKRSNGTGEVERLTTSPYRQNTAGWSPDGKTLTFTGSVDGEGPDLFLYRQGEDPEVEVFLATPFNEWNPRISPDGQWVSYSSNESGTPETYVRPAAGGGGQIKISTTGGPFAIWNPVGDELLYWDPSGKIMSVSYTVENGTFRPALPQKVCDFSVPPFSFGFSITPDGRRFLGYKSVAGDSTQRREPLVVINWFDELEAKVPAAR